MKLQFLVACLLTTLATQASATTIAGLPYPANATGYDSQSAALLLSAGISEADAAARARTSSEDKILKIERVIIDKRTLYKIKILTSDGRVKVVYVDAEE